MLSPCFSGLGWKSGHSRSLVPLWKRDVTCCTTCTQRNVSWHRAAAEQLSVVGSTGAPGSWVLCQLWVGQTLCMVCCHTKPKKVRWDLPGMRTESSVHDFGVNSLRLRAPLAFGVNSLRLIKPLLRSHSSHFSRIIKLNHFRSPM